MSTQGPTPAEVEAHKREEMLDLGEVLGLDPGFVQDVAARGQLAIIERIMTTDKSGAQSRLLALVQRVALLMEDNAIAGRPMPEDDMIDAIAKMADDLELNPVLALQIVDPVLDIYQQATRVLSREVREDGNRLLQRSGETEGAGRTPTGPSTPAV